MSSEVKKKERQDLLVQVEDFLHKQQFSNQSFSKKQEIEEEVGLFLNLLGNINSGTPKSQQQQLSTIISQGSNESTLPSFRETKYKYVDQFVQSMLKYLREIKKNQFQLQDVSLLIDSIYQYYLNQMNDIDKLIQYAYDIGNRKNFVTAVGDQEIKQCHLEEELENSLLQAHQLNDQLNSLLKQKTSDNYYKEKQCKQALQSVALLESQLKQFQGQFKSFNSIIKVINNKLNDVVTGPQSDQKSNKLTTRTNFKQINSYRTHFTNTTPNKKRPEDNYRSTSQNSYRSRREEIDKVYKQILKNYP